ncbi:DNA-directed RNA polymerases I and III subunit RPAC1-like [Leptopilina heterotoma]|uniref:DNA-directed RNA polymerases I and III subunit RPAC1-like n=1 Tax=Leptopilina heterotoma TaxID=63436 RepID=UPI001CA81128|nr:DNA-directed RNA polymerases I and III subunit RPAC1-like [Leptopilina heterotoma]
MDSESSEFKFKFEELKINNESWSFKQFKEIFKIKIVKESEDQMNLEFDLINCQTSLVNTIRRILISEVASIAIDKIFIKNYDSIMQEEVLSHRLGLVPLLADPRLFEYRSREDDADNTVSDQDTLRFELKVSCTLNKRASKESQSLDAMYINHKVYSKDIKWLPIGRQLEIFPRGEEQVGVIHKDILLNKLNPGHEIDIIMEAVKGIGKDHAKFSPVSTAFYRLMQKITLLTPVKGEMAEKLKNCFSPGVIEIVKNESNETEAKVVNSRYDSCSRNVERHKDLKDCVLLDREPNHFIFTIESVGALPSSILFVEAVKVLKKKCRTFIDELNDIK